MLFDKLSPPADSISKIQFKFENIMKFLDLMNGNILYLTHEIDQIKKIVKKIENTSNLQKQVDDYFDETSPQTESDEQTSQ